MLHGRWTIQYLRLGRESDKSINVINREEYNQC